MLKRSKLLVVLLVVTVVCASIGFAAASDSLTAGGKVNINAESNDAIESQFDADVYFQSVDTSANTGISCDVTEFSSTTDALVFTLNNTVLAKQGDSVTVKAVIKNASEVQGVSLSAAIDNATFGTTAVTDAISVAYSFAENDTTTTTKSVSKGETATLYITIRLNKIPDANITPNAAQFTVTVTATPAT